MRLIKLELFKIYSQKVIYIAFSIFLLYYGLFFYSGMEDRHEITLQRESYSQYGGEWTEEKDAWATAAVEEFEAARQEVLRMNPDEPLPINPELIAKSKVAVHIANVSNSRAFHAEHVGELQAWVDKQGPAYIFYEQGWKNILLFMPEIGYVFVAALTIFGVAGGYGREYASRMDSLLLSSPHGRTRLTTAKIAATAIYCASVVIAFNGIVFLLNGFYYGLQGFQFPLVNISSIYSGTEFDGAIAAFYGMQLLYAALGCTALGLLVLLISAFTHFSLMPAFLGLAALMLPVAIIMIIPAEGVVIELLLRVLRYYEMIQLDALDTGTLMPTFGLFALPYPVYLLFTVAMYIAITAVLIYIVIRRRQVTGL